MSVPLSRRLCACAALVPSGARVADVGTDHGYLGIYLLREGLCPYVAACDLREGPLENARRNANRFGIRQGMDFILSDGLHKVRPDSIDAVVCAGMGGDLIIKILSEAPWLKDARYTLVLQPQAGINELRAWLGAQGYREEQVALVRDAGFLYCAMQVRFTGEKTELSPGQQFLSSALLSSRSPLLGDYMTQLRATMGRIISGLSRAGSGADPGRLSYFRAALQELKETEAQYGNSQ